jgi:threonine synthase
MSIWRYADRIARVSPSARISLGEGNTPLVRSRRIGPAAGLENLYFKLESANPSGSYKDRFAAVAISALVDAGKTRCVSTSSGNTGAALAAYCAAAGIDCRIAIVETAPAGKLTQMLTYGARLQRVKGFGIDAGVTRATFSRLEQLATQPGTALEISAYRYSPVGMSGVETISYELAEQMPAAAATLEHIFSPSGGGGLTLAVARGFADLLARREIARSPRIHCVQPAGNDTIAGPLRAGSKRATEVECTSSISGLQVPSVIDGDQVIEACRNSGGTGYLVDDDEVWRMQLRLAREEGLFCEPAGAVALSGALRAAAHGEVTPQDTVVCLVTGSGFKDSASLEMATRDAQCDLVEWTAL